MFVEISTMCNVAALFMFYNAIVILCLFILFGKLDKTTFCLINKKIFELYFLVTWNTFFGITHLTREKHFLINQH